MEYIDYIDYEKLDKLLNVMNEYGIQLEWVKKLFNVHALFDINVWQYNYLLLIIQQVKEKYDK